MSTTTKLFIAAGVILGLAACDRTREEHTEAPTMDEQQTGAESTGQMGEMGTAPAPGEPGSETHAEPAQGVAEPMTGATDDHPGFESEEPGTARQDAPQSDVGQQGEPATRPQGTPAAETAGVADIVATARDRGQFNEFLSALEAADMLETLHGEGPFTVFAPTDQAFDGLSEDQRAEMKDEDNRERLREILEHHIIRGDMHASDLAAKGHASPLAGGALGIDTMGNELRVDGVPVVQPDIECSNGVIHSIDAVLVPAK